jgi:histone H3/H4
MGISKLTAKKILKECGAIRVSDEAADEFSEIMNAFSYKTATKAVKLAAHAKRKTVEKSDINLAK